MRIYAWWPPNTYGEWAFVAATTVEDAKIALAATKNKDFSMEYDPVWAKDYHTEMVDDMLTREPDVIEPGVVSFGEVA